MSSNFLLCTGRRAAATILPTGNWTALGPATGTNGMGDVEWAGAVLEGLFESTIVAKNTWAA